jgi:hypothetical protein
MLGRLTAVRPSDAARGCELLCAYWFQRGAYIEPRQRLRDLLDGSGLAADSQTMLLERLAAAEEALGHPAAAEDAVGRAVAAAEAAGREDLLARALREGALGLGPPRPKRRGALAHPTRRGHGRKPGRANAALVTAAINIAERSGESEVGGSRWAAA